MKKDFKTNPAELFISTAEEEPVKGSETAADVAIPKGYKLVKEYKSERMQLLIRPAIKEGLKREAQEQGLSVNDLANNIFEEYLERKG